MLSYWEKQSLLNCDIIIVGSGIVGLSTAIAIKQKRPSANVLVLERGILPTGASTKNAGFACIGSLTEILDDLASMPEDEVLQLVELRYKGLRRLRGLLGDEAIEYAENGSYELIGTKEEHYLDELESTNNLLKRILKRPAFTISNEKIAQFGFDKRFTKNLVKNNFEGELHTGKMMRALIQLCVIKGIEIKTGCNVLSINEGKSSVTLQVHSLQPEQKIDFTASRVIICTNAFTRQFYSDVDVHPGRGQVLLTKPIPRLKFKGIFHFDKGYYYFRELNGRVLFGGGRNVDFTKERTLQFGFNEKIRKDLKSKLKTIILPKQKFEIEDWWTGIMAFGSSKFPLLLRPSERIFLGVRMGGMGVAIGSEIGERLAMMVLEDSSQTF